MKVLFLWHMHQPAYFVNENGRRVYYLPWVLQHALREYYEMPYILSKFDEVKVTFNLVPVLIEQLLDYAEGKAECKFTNLALKPADSLTEEEIKFILFHFFNVSEKTRIRPYPRYYYLLRKRGKPHEIESRWKYFTLQDLRDLKFYWLFSAISPLIIENHPVLKELGKKGQKYSDEDVKLLYQEMVPLIKETVDLYRELHESKHIEISTTPYYHPILPVICNSKNAEISNPYTRKPDFTFSEPENAKKHIAKAVQFMAETMKVKVQGMWPAEGSVSMDTVDIYREYGIKWIATDEEILFKSLRTLDREKIYKPYLVNGIKIFFRDRILSDKIGFEYTRQGEVEAALDLFERLRDLSKVEDRVVSIILDGENPWDNYPNGGLKFLETLYSLLNKCTRIKTATFSEVAEEGAEPLHYLHPGSWIRGDFTTWVGHEEKNRAWKYLAQVKSMLKGHLNPQAEEELMCAEGSDWFWWYGDDNFTLYFREFDELFRKHLKRALELANLQVPDFLEEPIKKEIQSITPSVLAVSYINPKIDGLVESYYEYLGAGEFDVSTFSTGQMVVKSYFLERIVYGFNDEKIFLMLRLQPGRSIERVELYFEGGSDIVIDLKQNSSNYEGVEFAYRKVLEIALPLGLCGNSKELKFYLIVRGEEVTERYPRVGSFKINKLQKDEIDQIW
uniref:Glycoside hydrolase family 57 N-terminal domain-containing protein n=1 Tax=candidate division WOR-3 bacterium TaxID=2052148 RepID=A0A7V3KPH9_UNCW3